MASVGRTRLNLIATAARRSGGCVLAKVNFWLASNNVPSTVSALSKTVMNNYCRIPSILRFSSSSSRRNSRASSLFDVSSVGAR